MDTKEIKKLLNSFYAGETSAEEECALLNYFNSNDVAQELLEEKGLFLKMYEAENVDVPADFEPRLSLLIDRLAEKEQKDNMHPHKKIHLWKQIAGIAASIAIFISAGIYFSKSARNDDNKFSDRETKLVDTYSDPQQAYAEAEKALIILSANFNKGVSQLSVVSNNLDKSNEILNKTFKRKKEKES